MTIFRNLGGITTKLLMILTFAFLLIVLVVALVIETQAKPKVIAMTSDTIEEAGNEVVNSITSSMSNIDGLARATSAMSGALPKNDKIYEQAIGNLMMSTDDKIVGGGVWFDPNMYKADHDRQSFVWSRDASGTMQHTDRYNSLAATPNDYYRDWWYTPAMYARHDYCVWSRAYVDKATQYPMITCAKAIYSSLNQAFEGVVSFNVVLSNLDQMMSEWQDKFGGDKGLDGYVFLLDLDNRFLSFPDKSLVTYETEANPQGEVMSASKFAELNPKFSPIADSVNSLNKTLIQSAIDKDEGRFNIAAGSIHSQTNLNKISKEESSLLSALLLMNVDESKNSTDTHLMDTVSVPNDFYLQQDATAFVFRMPYTYWKVVIVKPTSSMMAVANKLSKQLVQFMFLGFIPILLLTALAFRRFLTLPLRRMAGSVEKMGELIQQSKYRQLANYKLPHSSMNEIQIISDKTNQLIDRVVENEGALADINSHLEHKITERTQVLQKTMDDLKASQVQLVQAEKMATIGEMVAGVAHEVNTPLGYVRSNLELVGENLSRYDDLIKNIELLLVRFKDESCTREQLVESFDKTTTCCQQIKEDELSEDLSDLVTDGLFGIDQISELILSLRDFSRIDETKIKEIDINQCIKSSLTMAKNNLKKLTIHQNLEDLPPIQCNPAQINQVLLNIFNNAAQAIPNDRKGHIHISSKVSTDNVVIQIADNGLGMSREIIECVFEPFYTTKKAGEGTGLGLAISRQIVEQHNGSISVQSKPDKGTIFTLIIPINQPITLSDENSHAIFT